MQQMLPLNRGGGKDTERENIHVQTNEHRYIKTTQER